MNMQTKETLLQLGFKHYEKWDSEELKPVYRLDFEGLIFRAHAHDETSGYPNEHRFVSLGLVVKNSGIVDRWRDCCSEGSIKRKIDYEYKRANKLGRIKSNADRRQNEYTQKQSA